MLLFFRITYNILSQFFPAALGVISYLTRLLALYLSNTYRSFTFSFVWLLALLEIAENPTDYNVLLHTRLLIVILFTFSIFLLVFYLFKEAIFNLLQKLFDRALKNSLCKSIILYYCYFILCLRGFFEKENHPMSLALVFFSPTLLYVYELLCNNSSIFANPFFWMCFWFSLSIFMLSLDQLGVIISSCLLNYPTDRFSKELALFEKNKSFNDFYQKGIFPAITKLSAAGQGALYAGIASAVTGIGVASINAIYNDRKDIRQAARETADRQAQAAREAAARQAQAARDAASHAAKASKRADQYAEAERNRQQASAEAERTRQHDRDRWSHEEKREKPNKSWFK